MSKLQAFLKHSNSKISPENFSLFYEELKLMRSSSYIDKHEEQCKEVIQLIIEYLIYGDKNDSTIFDLFCEFNFMNEFIYLSNLNNRNMNLQIIKSFSVLILNLTNTTTLYFIFSNNFINQIISNNYERYDEDFLSYYVNFLKSLSLKIDPMTIQFFFHKGINSFPLLEASLRLYNHNDPMIKNVVRNTILTLLKIKYDPIVDYFSSLPSITYFPFISCRLRDLIIKLNDEVSSDDQQTLKSIHDDIIDDILYIQDIFSLKLEKINYILTNSLFYYMILPLLCGSLVSMTKPKITLSVSLYIILVLFHYIKDETFLNVLFTVMFMEKLNKKLLRYMEEFPKAAKNYFFDWTSQKKSSYNSFTNYIMFNFSEPFLLSLIYLSNSPYSEVRSIVTKYEKILEFEKENTNSATLFQNILEDILAKFSNSEIDIMTAYHKNLSVATGVNVGLALNDNKKDSILKIIERVYDKMKNEQFDELNKKFFKNECRENLYSYLRSKDDTLILLMNMLIYTIHRKGLSEELLSKARLLRVCDMKKSNYDTKKILNEIFSFDFLGAHNATISTTNVDEASKENLKNLPLSDQGNSSPELTGRTSKNEIGLLAKTEHSINTTSIKEKDIDLTFPFEENSNNKATISTQIRNGRAYSSGDITANVFDNNFFYDKFSGIDQKQYDYELVDNILNLLMVEPAFRTITNRLILANIKSLILSSDESSNMIDRNHLDIINRIYYTFLSNIKLIIINNKYIRETGYEHFETEWKNYKQDISSIVEDLISQSFLIIPFNLEDLVEDYPRILKLQKNELDTFKSCLIVFMTLHDIRQMIYQEKDLIRNGFPLKLGGFELDTEQIYNLQNLGLEMYNCKVKVGSNFYDYIMLVYQNNLYFGLPDNKDQLFTMIKYKYALRHLEAQIDRGDPRILNLIVYEKGKYMEIALAFEDVTRTTAIKKNLEEHRKSARNTEYLLLDSYFDDLISKWKF